MHQKSKKQLKTTKGRTKKIFLAFLSVFIAAIILLLLDLNNRSVNKNDNITKIAIFKISSRLLLDETENGIIKILSENNFHNNKNYNIDRFCAEGDLPTANLIAQNIMNSRYDVVITISTPALQVMANANKKGKIKHVFCAVTDPYNAGVGIIGEAPNQHPPHLVGIGTFQPVEEAFDIAKKMKPDLKKVGTVWCTSEVCSEACVNLARKKCKELNIELVELSVESTTQVLEAAMSLSMQGIEAFWLGGDNIVEAGIDQLINAAAKSKIPLFTNNPYNVYGNALFGLGAKYFDVGKIAGKLAIDILNGKPCDEISIKNVVPKNLIINSKALENMKDKWDITKF